MSATRFLTRARLRRDISDAALRDLLAPPRDTERGASVRSGAAHHLVWHLFGDTPERTRDFLWREGDPGVFYLLSERPPEDRRGLFAVDPPKPFAPVLTAGDRLSFALRVNATVARASAPGVRGKPCDVVMDALRDVTPDARAGARREVLPRVARAWLAAQGARCGFALPDPAEDDAGDDGGVWSGPGGVRVLAYRTLRIDRGRGAAAMRIGVLDVEGVLEVRDPGAFVDALGNGFGRAKAFGCGLMLVRRAPAWA